MRVMTEGGGRGALLAEGRCTEKQARYGLPLSLLLRRTAPAFAATADYSRQQHGSCNADPVQRARA